MHPTALAGLPRLVRVPEEVRLRGQTSVTIAVAVAAYWLLVWVLKGPIDPVVTWANFGAIIVLAGVVAAVVSGRRLREGLAGAMPPPRLAVHETPAAGRERRTRMAGMLVLAVVLLLVFDRVTEGDGRMAGLVAGLFLAVGVVDWRESRRWHAAERVRGSRLYVLVRPRAFMSPFGVTEVFEVAKTEDDRRRREIESEYLI